MVDKLSVNMGIDKIGLEQEVQRAEMMKKIQRMLDSGMPVIEVAEILDAKQFLSLQRQRGRHGNVLVFNVRDFVDHILHSTDSIKLPDAANKISKVILPPGEGGITTGGEKKFEKKKSIPRTKFLMELLYEIGVPYILISGAVTDSMVRGSGYQVFVLDKIRKAVFVNNEEDNATFVLHDLESKSEWEKYANLSKEELKSDKYNCKVSWHKFSGDVEKWKQELKLVLEQTGSTGKETLEDINLTQEERVKSRAPAGWLTKSAIAKQLGQGKIWLSPRIETLLEDRPEWSKPYLDEVGHTYTYYSPELIVELKKIADLKVPSAPSGWMTEWAIAKHINKREGWVKKHAKPFKADRPEWVMYYLDSIGNTREHYSPELIVELKKIADLKVPFPPPGWMTFPGIVDLLGKGSKLVNRVVSVLAKEHPEWTGYYAGANNRMRTYYSPELINELSKTPDIRSKPAPPGWSTLRGVAEAIGKDKDWVAKRISQVVQSNPDWVSYDYLDSLGRSGHALYSPELISKMRTLKETTESK